jgi:uncharacterized protein
MMMMLPPQVAEVAIVGLLAGKRVIVPGAMNKLMLMVNRLLPLSLRMRMLRGIAQKILPQGKGPNPR